MENLTGGTPPVRYLPCVVPCKLYFCSALITGCSSKEDGASAIQKVSFVVADDDESTITYVFREYYIKGFADDVLLLESEYKDSVVEKEGKQVKAYCEKFVEIE